MMKYLYALLLPVFITACSSNKGKYTVPRLKAISIHGEASPWITFTYNTSGQMTSLTRHNKPNDTNTIKFLYDASQRLSGMICESALNNQVTVTRTATVKDWDLNGNIRKIDFFDEGRQHVRTAQVRWQNNQPMSLKYTDAKQATSWSYIEGNPDWKNIEQDSSPTSNDSTIWLTRAQCEWDDSYNPLRTMANQLLLADTIPQCRPAAPLPDLASLLLHVSSNNPSLVKLEEKQETRKGNMVSQFTRNATVQYMYAYNGNGYPRSAQVYLHAKGYTQQRTDVNATVDYLYE
jgi:hypothetical protein